jgi:predicted DCC family thiol-disulfide oxidoreductase YuxK
MEVVMKEKLTVYFDASCALCKREMAVIRLHDVAQRLSWVDCSAAEFDDAPFRAEGVTQEDMMASLHLRAADGAWVKGVDAFALLYRTVGMNAMATLWGGKWTRPLTERLYPWVARHRILLSWAGLLFVLWGKYAARQALRRSQSCRDGACSLPPLAHSWERGWGRGNTPENQKPPPLPSPLPQAGEGIDVLRG